MQSAQKRLVVMIVILILSAVLFVLGLFILPDTIVVQITASGADGNTLPKPLGLILPLGLSAFFAWLFYKRGEGRNLALALLGIVLYGLTFYFNR